MEVFMYRKSLFAIVLIVISAGFLSGGVAENATESGSADQSAAKVTAPQDDFFSTGTSSSGITVTFKRLGNNTARTPVSLSKSTAESKADAGGNAASTNATAEERPAGASANVSSAMAQNRTAQSAAPAVAASAGAAPASNVSASTPEGTTPEGNLTSNVTSESGASNATAATNLSAVVTPEGLTPEGNLTSNATSAIAGNASLAGNQSPALPALLASTNISAENLTAGNVTEENVTAAENVTEEVVEAPEEVAEEEFTDRIWREGMPETYTWTPQTFSGFFYDLDDRVGTEKLTVSLSRSGDSYNRAIDTGNIRYTSDVQDISFEFDDWGKYQVIGFMAEKYFAGYSGTEVVDDVSLINENQLRRVLIDSDEEKTITAGSVLPLEEGYELRIKEIDINGNKVHLALAKDGDEVDSKVISPDSLKSATYMYEEKIGGKDVPLIMAHVSNVFAGAESSLVTIDGLFQISDTYASVEEGDKYDKMEVVSVSDSGIELENKDSVTLRKGTTVRLMGGVGLQVADSDVLRFAPVVERTGTYEVRGTVVDPSRVESFTWTPYNFEGFYYDIDEDIGTEKLVARFSGSKIEDGDLKYETSPQPVEFEFDSWGRYDVIGFMADKYFAGYNNETLFTDEFSIINNGELRKVLIDSDEERTISSGSVLPLEDGYELQIKEVDLDGNKVWLSLTKSGKEVDSKVVTPVSGDVKASTYTYKVRISSEDVPIIAAHISNVFRGREADLATVDGIFQVSDTPESVEEGDKHGKMEVDSLSDDGITMKNDGSISLGRGKDIEIMGNLKFRVADNPERNLCPIALRVGKTEPLRLNLTEAIVGKPIMIQVTSGGKAVSGAKVLVGGKEIGTTDAGGMIRYTPERAGSVQVQAKLSGYEDASGTLLVRSEAELRRLVITAPPEVMRGETFVVTVRGGANATQPIEGANVSVDGVPAGVTDSKGSLSLSVNETGDHTISVEAAGYDRATKSVKVLSPISVVSMNVTGDAIAGKPLKIVAEVQNTGKSPDSRQLQLLVNRNATGNKSITVKPGEIEKVTFEYRPKEPGVYTFEVEGIQKTVSVEEAKGGWLVWAVALLIILLAGIGVYLYRTGELEELKKRLKM
ncbi:MAG: S-layer protein domain-containing protein [Methanothrix sp.]|uniref:S-layer protein domain-containing protein n=1 Tax=Methanothrix sp. TaxID=90426 RepID=UPI0032AFCD8E|nr:S-layer protein domain-containing protein [Methanothrix sp.]